MSISDEATRDQPRGAELRPKRRTGAASRSTPRSHSERRKEVIEATLALVAGDGLERATLSNIAEVVGLKTPSLYAHFASHEEILMESMDVLFERVFEWLRTPQDADILSRLKAIIELHGPLTAREFEGFVAPMSQFILAPGRSGLRDIGVRKNLQTIDLLSDLVDEGKRQGSIREDMDSRQAAWEVIILAWAEDLARLSGMDEFMDDSVSKRIAALFLADMAGDRSQPPTNGGAANS